MTDRLTNAEMADIFLGEAWSMADLIEKHSHGKDRRPDSWFVQMRRIGTARRQAAEDYKRAAQREQGAA
ncbi:hypothetical protein ACTJJ7_20100 [Phyllobacterium sp. 22229]|uniref:hypothetical protein n=1 Tax=Phyllobacterium sp. 22229 TaxID=3453895 RepID=UPI003F83B68F